MNPHLKLCAETATTGDGTPFTHLALLFRVSVLRFVFAEFVICGSFVTLIQNWIESRGSVESDPLPR